MKTKRASYTKNGFTLIEVILVLFLISLMFFFTFPRFKASFSDGKKTLSRWIMIKVPSLKNQAVLSRSRFFLHVNIDNGLLWVTNESMSEEESMVAEKEGYRVPDNINIQSVEFLKRGSVSDGNAIINFYKEGYSDKAIIHIYDENYQQVSFIIEPFLTRVKYFEKYMEIKS